MKQTGAKLISALAVVLLGFGFPAILAYFSAVYGFNIWYAGIFTFLSLLGAVAIPIVVLGIAGTIFSDDEEYAKEVRIVKEALATLLTKMDDLIEELSKIDTILQVEE